MPITAFYRRRPFLTFLFIATAILSAEVWIGNVALDSNYASAVSLAIAADLAIGLPLLFYVLVVRRGHASITSLLSIFVLALFAVRMVVPGLQLSIISFAHVIAAAELVGLAIIAVKARAIVKHTRQTYETEVYLSDALMIGIERALGSKLVSTLASAEISMFYFAICGWFTRFKPKNPNYLVFAYHRTGGMHIITFALLFLVLVETSLVHLLVSQWNDLAAWILTALSLYGAIWMIGHFQASRLQPIVIDSTNLHIRTGLIWRTMIPLKNIEGVRRFSWNDSLEKGTVNLSVMGRSAILIKLKDPVEITGLFGRKKSADLVGTSVENPGEFETNLRSITEP